MMTMSRIRMTFRMMVRMMLVMVPSLEVKHLPHIQAKATDTVLPNNVNRNIIRY